jgi:hypothetical protein
VKRPPSNSIAPIRGSKQHVNGSPTADKPGPEKVPALGKDGFPCASFNRKPCNSICHLPWSLNFFVHDRVAVRNHREARHLLFKFRLRNEAWLCLATGNLLQRKKKAMFHAKDEAHQKPFPVL